MLTTIYKNEQGIIDKVVLSAQSAEESRELLACVESFKKRADGSGTLRYNNAKGDYATDPRYGIGENYTSQSAAVDVRGNTLPTVRELPTQEEADKIAAQAEAEREQRKLESQGV